MAGHARGRGWGHVCASQSKSCRAVIECRCSKTNRRVTSGAVGNGECWPGCGVRRSGRSLPAAAIVGAQMATGISAISRRNRQCIVVVDVAQGASYAGVCIGQRESGGVVIEDSRGPGGDRVAGRTGGSSGWETSRDVIRNVAANRRCALENSRVASVTIGGIERVVVVHVAGRARRWRRRHVCPGQGKSCHVVVERRGIPSHGGVARRAVGGGKCSPGSGVHGIICPLPGRQMASGISAIGRRNRQSIVVVDVAQGALHTRMSVGQRESSRVVVEHSSRPGSNRVASGACRCGSWETGRDVIRHVAANRRGALESSRVATVTIRRIQRVVVAHMARRAGSRRRRHVRAGQSKSCRAVIKSSRRPAGRIVASGAVHRSKRGSRSGVNRIVGLLPGGQMALRISAIGWGNRQIVVVIDVARSAGHIGVSGGEQESCGAVIECCGCPAGCCVACRAIHSRKCSAGRRVHRVCRRLPRR